MVGYEKHPADEIGRSLLRAGGILSSLTICYNKEHKSFELDNNFVFEALSAVETMLSQAGEALGRLYSGYDLSPLRTVEQDNVAVEAPPVLKAPETPAETVASGPAPDEKVAMIETVVSIAAAAAPEVIAPAESKSEPKVDVPETELAQVGYFPSSEQVNRLSEKLDTIIASLQVKNPAARDEQADDQRAKSYLEFLDKLTAMADLAAIEATRAGKQDKSLLPILDSLRADVMRLREVA